MPAENKQCEEEHHVPQTHGASRKRLQPNDVDVEMDGCDAKRDEGYYEDDRRGQAMKHRLFPGKADQKTEAKSSKHETKRAIQREHSEEAYEGAIVCNRKGGEAEHKNHAAEDHE